MRKPLAAGKRTVGVAGGLGGWMGAGRSFVPVLVVALAASAYA